MSHQVVIIGGGYAGILAAQRLHAAQVTLINNRSTFTERIRLHQVAAGERRPEHAIPGLLRKGVTFVQGHVSALDLDGQQVIYRDDAGEHTLPYDSLIYALGSKTGNLPQQPVGAHGRAPLRSTEKSDAVFTLDPASTERLAARLRELPAGAHVAVVGGGLTGIESASEIAESYPHLHVSLVTRGAFGERLSRKGRAHLYATFQRLNVQICDHLDVQSIGDRELITERGAISYDACVWTAGFTVPMLAREAGLAVNDCGQIVVDRTLRSLSHPNVYAAGDAAWVAEMPIPIRMACATALPMGGHVADNLNALLTGGPAKPFEFRYYWQCISLGRNDALVQIASGDDMPRERILTGKGGAVFKEMICRLTINVLRLERHVPGLYRVPA
ncbi:MAG: FAD-dependent oxidoreductase [Chloroflexi bacterium]|nr:FAD-dependent oxidoreductase [Chloroflexota bacterium]